MSSDPVVHRRYVSHADAHYGGGIAAGAFVLGLFGDVATEWCIRSDGDEGLLAGYSEVRFLAPIRAGDVLEVRVSECRRGRRSRELAFEALVVARARPERGPSAAAMVHPPQPVATATGTVVVPGPAGRG